MSTHETRMRRLAMMARAQGHEDIAREYERAAEGETMTTEPKTYKIMVGKSERLRFTADLEQAAAPVFVIGEDGERSATPYQTADGRHSAAGVAEELISWCSAQGAPAVDDEEEWTVVAG